MEDAIANTNGCFSILKWIPCQADARLEIVELVVVEIFPGAGANNRKGERVRNRTRIGEKLREIIVHLEGHAEVFPPQAVGGGEIRQNFPSVLNEQAPLAIAESALVRRDAGPALLKYWLWV